jgi:hypothetical protein
MTPMSILLGVLFLALLLFLVAYVTWLLAVRLRAGESPYKSFFRWLRDLWDLASGL